MRTHPFNFGALYCILGLNLTPPPWGAAPGGEGKEGNQGDRKTIEVMETVACPQNPALGPKTESIRERPKNDESIRNRVESILKTSEACAVLLFRVGTTPLCAPA